MFKYIGDDLWMLVCSSSESVNRILSLNRWMFGEVNVLADRWITVAGRSAIMAENATAWVVARGIPLHLRSKKLFKALGDRCRGFIRADEVSSLSSIRIKVSAGASIPEEVLVRFGTTFFPIRVELEGKAPMSPVGAEPEFFRRWKAKGKGNEVWSSKGQPAVDEDTPSCSRGPFHVRGEKAPGEGPLGNSDVPPVRPDITVETLNVVRRGQIGSSSPAVVSEVSGAVRKPLAFMGLKINNKEELCLVSKIGESELRVSLSLDVGLNGYSASRPNGKCFEGKRPLSELGSPLFLSYLFDNYVGLWSMGGPMWKFCFGPDVGFPTSMPMSFLRDCSKEETILEGGKMLLPSSSCILFPSVLELASTDDADPKSSGEVCSSLTENGVGSASGEVCYSLTENGVGSASETSEEVRLLGAVHEVASVIGINLNGNLAQGLHSAREVCKEVYKRKSKPVSQSRTDREHRRLGVSPESLADLLKTTGRERCVSP
ncbi:hypothetical protein LINPERHAP1_LOCUS7072 [Linum perenne]